MSNLFREWAVDQAIDIAVEKAEEMGIYNDHFVDWLADKEFENLLNSAVCEAEEGANRNMNNMEDFEAFVNEIIKHHKRGGYQVSGAAYEAIGYLIEYIELLKKKESSGE
jgi:arsenate reductase-like glutaredoxin family protein